MGTNSKTSGKNTPKFHLIPAYTKTHIYVEKINLITRSISKFISLIYFSIKITIKEYLAKNRGHLSSGNTIAYHDDLYLCWKKISKYLKSGYLMIKFQHHITTFNLISAYDMGLDVKKSVSGVCEQQLRRPACASVQSDQHLCYSLLECIISKLATSKFSIS